MNVIRRAIRADDCGLAALLAVDGKLTDETRTRVVDLARGAMAQEAEADGADA
jgi:hypothetical protein